MGSFAIITYPCTCFNNFLSCRFAFWLLCFISKQNKFHYKHILIISKYYFLQAETECTAQQRATCDGGSGRASCAVSNGDVFCSCPSGFALNSTNYCIGNLLNGYILGIEILFKKRKWILFGFVLLQKQCLFWL